MEEAAAPVAIPAAVPPKIRPMDPAVSECRLCEEFPTFMKPVDFHKHLAEIHFRMELNNDLPQATVSPVLLLNVKLLKSLVHLTLIFSHDFSLRAK